MLKIRLRRMGSRHRPFYRVVVSDARNVPTAAALDEIGYYDPCKKPAVVKIDSERVEFWQGRGAQLSSTVRRLVRQAARPVAVANSGSAEPAAKKVADKAAAEPVVKVAEKAAPAAEAAAKETPAAEESATEEAASEVATPAEAAAVAEDSPAKETE